MKFCRMCSFCIIMFLLSACSASYNGVLISQVDDMYMQNKDKNILLFLLIRIFHMNLLNLKSIQTMLQRQ